MFGILMLPARALDAPQNCFEMDGLKLDNLQMRERDTNTDTEKQREKERRAHKKGT